MISGKEVFPHSERFKS